MFFSLFCLLQDKVSEVASSCVPHTQEEAGKDLAACLSSEHFPETISGKSNAKEEGAVSLPTLLHSSFCRLSQKSAWSQDKQPL